MTVVDKIYHVTKPDKVYDIDMGSGKNIEVKSGDMDALGFIADYMNFYSDKVDEKFDHPIYDNATINDLFGDELILYGTLVPGNDYGENKNRIKRIKMVAEIALELHLTVLVDKLCILLYFYMIMNE